MSVKRSDDETEGRRAATLARVGGAVAAVLAVSVLTVHTSRAAFTSRTDNTGSTASAGTVRLTDDDAGSAMFTVTNMKPGDTVTRCINVTYSGSLTSDVKLYGAAAGTGLASYLNTKIEIGAGAAGGAAMDCAGFTPTSTLNDSLLSAFAATRTDYVSGLAGFTSATAGATRSYRVTVTLLNDDAAQGKNATASFTWEAQNI